MLTGLKLLLVEDDEDDYILTRDLLEELHPGQVTLEWVSTLKNAMDALRRHEHDLCLVDFQLGADNGLQLIRYARSEAIHTPIIMLTGYYDANLDIEAQRAGAVDFLVKRDLNSTSLGRSIRYARARRQAEEERLQRLQAEAENRLKSQFLTHLSHELRTPLTSILGYTELLLMKEREAKKLQDLRTIERNGRHLLNLLNDLLDLSRIEAGKLLVESRPVKLEDLLVDIQSQLAVRASEKNIELHFAGVGELPESIDTDSTRLQQILINLLGNAIKFTDEGRVDLLVSVTPDNGNRERLTFQITDTGIGISDAVQKTIFEPFSQASKNIGDSDEHGFGLGLAISQELAQHLGGGITCESKPGVGSTFTLTLGATARDAKRHKALNFNGCRDIPLTSSLVALAGRILVVDDLEDVRQLLGSALIRSGAEVVFAINGRDAVEQVLVRETSDRAIDAVVMDLQMPVLDGWSALQALRTRGFERPVIALTASAMHGERERCLQAGFSDYLGKPFDLEHLLNLLSGYLADTSGSGLPQHTPTASPTSGTVLLVEDDEDARRATAKLIAHLGWSVMAAANAAEALAFVDEHSDGIKLALIDLGLPDLHGCDLAQQIRARQADSTCIIALSGAPAEPERLQQSGFDRHIMKPINLRQIQDLLQTLGNER